MTPDERDLYMMHYFDLGDQVHIGETHVTGEVTGMRIAEGEEDQYRVTYVDASGNPQERWWRASLLEDVAPTSNVIRFPVSRTRH